MNNDSRIYVAGHRGLVGSALCRMLKASGFETIITATHSDLNLCDPIGVREFFQQHRPEYVFLAAAQVGGVGSNEHHEVDFLLGNMTIQNNVLLQSMIFGVKKLLFLGSACIYPRMASEPVREADLLTGSLEPSNQWYAIAKIAGLKLCQAFRRQYGCDFISAMPTNLYGPGDKYDLQSCHVLPALIRKFSEAKLRGESSVTCWGTGTARREFLYSYDLADACVELMNHYSGEDPVNIGTGRDMTISELADAIAHTVGYTGRIEWDTTKPDGTPRRLLDNSKLIDLGWRPQVKFMDGLRMTYEDFIGRQLDPKLIYDNMR
jgi:GDP-L-fucose synthase